MELSEKIRISLWMKTQTDKSFELDFRIDSKLMEYPFVADAMILLTCMCNTKQIVVFFIFWKRNLD